MIDFFQQIHNEVQSIFFYDIETTNTNVVPNSGDPGLTFPYDANKRGKMIETCVLFIDIRSSTSISKRLAKKKIVLGKLYSAFIHAMVHIADEYGYIRNIVGDRVMVVFEPETCFEDALNCAAVMYSVARRIIGKFAKSQAGVDDFKVGIGIDWGEMLILKTGKIKRFREASEYKGLVWVGDAANNASKLTDYAAKEHSYVRYDIQYEELSHERVLKPRTSGINPIIAAAFAASGTPIKPLLQYEMQWIKTPRNTYLTESEFGKTVSLEQTGPVSFTMKYGTKQITTCKKQSKTFTAWSILISGKVYEGLKRVSDGKHPFLQKISKADYPTLPAVGGGVYKASLYLSEIEKIKD